MIKQLSIVIKQLSIVIKQLKQRLFESTAERQLELISSKDNVRRFVI
jgi:hypothetical protein